MDGYSHEQRLVDFAELGRQVHSVGAFGWPPRGAPGGEAVTPWPTKKEISKGVAAVRRILVKETGWTLEAQRWRREGL